MQLTQMPKYENYKDSGVDWIAEIPAYWRCQSLRSIFAFRNEKNDPVITEDILSLSIANGVTPYSEERRGGNKAKNDLSAYKIARPNDIVLNSMNVVVGAVGRSDYFGAISPVYYALFLRNADHVLGFYEYIFQNKAFQRDLIRLGRGILIKKGEGDKLNTIRMKVSTSDLKLVEFPIPPTSAQKAIAAFLDEKTAKIDEAIAIKERQIALLKERKQIIIQNAVTKGLNPDVPMKDSGVKWIGQIPAHWEASKIRFQADLIDGDRGPNYPSGNEVLDEGILFLSSKNIMDRALDLSNLQFISAAKFRTLGRGKLQRNDVIITMRGTTGNTAIFDCEYDTGFINAQMMIMRAKKGICPKFLSLLTATQVWSHQIDVLSYGSAQQQLSGQIIKNIFVGIPPMQEQREIADQLANDSNEIGELAEAITRKIAVLKEYKTTLINSAVTGKIKVM